MMRLVRRLLVLVSAIAIALVLLSWARAFVGQIVRVEGTAMAPTIEHGNFVLVNKLAYQLEQPRRGDVVMHVYPVNPRKAFVKRIIAMEGDTVRIVDGKVFVNEVPRDDGQVPETFRSHDHWGPQVVPAGYCFVMGDHRNNSSDSRHWGFVPVKYVLGRVAFRLTGSRPLSAVR
jgi:signal peptidase I